MDSSLKRIQRFMAAYMLDTRIIACFVFSPLSHKPPYRLTIGRTNWKFGTTDSNILVLSVVYQGIAFPILYKMMPKFGNFSTRERIELMEDSIGLFGAGSIECRLADREFAGEQWLAYLNSRRIRYHIRIRGNFWIVMPGNGRRVKASWLFNHVAINQYSFHSGIPYVRDCQLCYLPASKMQNRQGIPELQIIVSFNKPDESLSLCKERWQIESAFKALKTSGFNIEDTHLTDLDRINKLLALVLFAFTWVYLPGVFLDSLRPIKIKNNGKSAKSLFKYGIVYLVNVLFSNDIDKFKDICKFLSCT